jgi:hypothetical protein
VRIRLAGAAGDEAGAARAGKLGAAKSPEILQPGGPNRGSRSTVVLSCVDCLYAMAHV